MFTFNILFDVADADDIKTLMLIAGSQPSSSLLASNLSTGNASQQNIDKTLKTTDEIDFQSNSLSQSLSSQSGGCLIGFGCLWLIYQAQESEIPLPRRLSEKGGDDVMNNKINIEHEHESKWDFSASAIS